MRIGITWAWLGLAIIHLPPAAVVVSPGLTKSLYGVSPDGTAGILLVHRGALFLALVAVAGFAAFDARIRRAGTVAMAVSMVGFLTLYTRAGWPSGPLETIARVDAAALIPLAFVCVDAWRSYRRSPA